MPDITSMLLTLMKMDKKCAVPEVDSHWIFRLFLIVDIRKSRDYAYFGNTHILQLLDFAYFLNMHIRNRQDYAYFRNIHIQECFDYAYHRNMHI